MYSFSHLGETGEGFCPGRDEFFSVVMKSWDADSLVSSLDLGEKRLLYYASIIQKLNGVFILAVFPHQREEPNPAFANPEIGGCKSPI